MRVLFFMATPIIQSTICTISIIPVTTNKMSGTFLHTGMAATHARERLLANIYRAFVRLVSFAAMIAPTEKQTPRTALISVVYAFI